VKPTCRCKYNGETDISDVGHQREACIHLSRNRFQRRDFVNMVTKFKVLQDKKIFQSADYLSTVQIILYDCNIYAKYMQ
jgi:hypothetical protein